MIRIDKGNAPPDVLAKRGRDAAARHCDAYDAGAREFKFDKVYRHEEVKKRLEACQHGKCCYCESKITHTGYGDVEHYRPKGGFRASEEEPLTQPGYYWLAYEWTNLFLRCTQCNQKFKANLFPLRDESGRARSHRDDIGKEEPLLLNPCANDPEEHISFSKYTPVALNGSPQGDATIKIADLDRTELNESRRGHLNKLVTMRELLEAFAGADSLTPAQEEVLASFAAHLHQACAPDAEYAGMVRAFLKGTPFNP